MNLQHKKSTTRATALILALSLAVTSGTFVSAGNFRDMSALKSNKPAEGTFSTQEDYSSTLLSVDRQELQQLIEAVHSLSAEDYTAESWAYLQTVLAEAQYVYNAPDATQAEVDQAASALQHAIDSLVTQQAGIGSIRNIFPDPIAAQIVANQIGNGNLDYVITQDDIDHVKGTDWANLFKAKGITDISGIEHFVNLEYLYLDNNQLTFLPENFGNLSKLRSLDLDNNQLVSLPQSIHNLSKMIILHLSNQQPRVPVQVESNALTLDNPISVGDTPVAPYDISHNGIHDGLTNQISWEDIPDGTAQLTFPFSQQIRIGLSSATFNGVVTTELTVGESYIENPIIEEAITEEPIIEEPIIEDGENRIGAVRDVFIDPIVAQIVADQIGDGSLDYVINQDDIDHVKGLQWASIFQDKGIADISGIEHFVNLTSLNLNNNQLTSLPENIGNLSKLTALYINNNQLDSLPDSIGNLTNLSTLYLNHNQLSSLPDNLTKLRKLAELQLDDNQLTSLPDHFGNLPNLYTLRVQRNQLTSFPENFGNLSELKNLLANDNQLTALPDNFGSLSRLSLLELQRNQLTSLPENFGKLSGLSILRVYNNQLTSLPESFPNLSNLVNLDLSNNQLTSLPEDIGNLTKLMGLELSNNQLTTLPDSFGNLTRLMGIYVSNNQLTHLPESIFNLSNLSTISAPNNQLTSLPENIGKLTQLTGLSLDNNQLMTLPDSLGNLTNLVSLTLHNNQLTTLPDNLDSLSKLSIVSLHDQQPTLPIQLTSNSLTLNNPISVGNTPVALSDISDNCLYDAATNQLIWSDIPEDATQLTFSFNHKVKVGSMSPEFSGIVNMPIERT